MQNHVHLYSLIWVCVVCIMLDGSFLLPHEKVADLLIYLIVSGVREITLHVINSKSKFYALKYTVGIGEANNTTL